MLNTDQSLPTSERVLGRFLARWADMARRFYIPVILIVGIGDGLLFHYTLTHLTISTSTADMISERLAWRKTFMEYREAFPQFFSNLLIVIDGDVPEVVDDAQRKLATALRSQSDRFEYVETPGTSGFFEQNGLLYLDLEDLESLSDRLAAAQPFLGRLASDTSLSSLFALLIQAQDTDAIGTDLAPIYSALGAAFAAQSEEGFHRVSWQRLFAGESPTERRSTKRLIFVKPRLDFGQLLPAGSMLLDIREQAIQLGIDPSHGLRVRLTGSVAMEHEELLSVTQGAVFAGLLSLILVTTILLFALRSIRLLIACILTLFAGLIATAGFAALTVGSLNLISIAFAVLYVGLGIDFTIHLSLRYRELRHHRVAHGEALRIAAADVGASLVFCALTTSIGFYAFIPTDFTGVAELGLISGTGMLISLVMTLTLLPALLNVFPLKDELLGHADLNAPLTLLGRSLRLHRQGTRIVTVLVTIGAIFLITEVKFDHNPLHLRDQTKESVSTFNELLADSRNTPFTLSVLRDDLQTAAETAGALESLDLVDRTVTLARFVPEDQNAKLEVIENMAWLIGPTLRQDARVRTDLDTDLESLTQLRDQLAEQSAPVAAALAARIDDWLAFVNQLPASEAQLALERLADDVLGTFPQNIVRLRRLLLADEVALDQLPEELQTRWITADGRQRVEIVPAEDVNDNEASRAFVGEVNRIVDDATGLPVVQIGASAAVLGAFRFALISALIVVSILLLTLTREIAATTQVLIPLLLAALLTGAAAVALGISFNFANIIALPLLLGVGVDNGIHMVHRERAAPPADGNVLGTSTARAILFSAMTTIASFGSLAFSAHPGTASMGRLLTVGMIVTVICTLVVLPALGRDRRLA